MAEVYFKRPPEGADANELREYLNYLVDELTSILTTLDEDNMTEKYNKEKSQ